ncbi:hypothetical protein EVAR_93097_1 [Eumeta japonica]|uniref:Uncharacterized protein n=1 Tax=Eumeta variegata TaxID=151549 RepID=A0A4C1TIK5_EUMVA|nr:hypothetical protein EVAR_93097_1 [Eumeta japonica]
MKLSFLIVWVERQLMVPRRPSLGRARGALSPQKAVPAQVGDKVRSPHSVVKGLDLGFLWQIGVARPIGFGLAVGASKASAGGRPERHSIRRTTASPCYG